MPAAVDDIRVITVVVCIHQERIVAVNVDSGTGRPGPSQIHETPSAVSGPYRVERNGVRC